MLGNFKKIKGERGEVKRKRGMRQEAEGAKNRFKVQGTRCKGERKKLKFELIDQTSSKKAY